MPAAAAPIIAASIGGAASVGSSIYASKKQEKLAKQAEANRFLFSEPERAAARSYLMQSLFQPLPQAPAPGTQGVPRNANPQQIMFAQFMKMVMDRYSRPTPQYQGYLSALQERRDARSGVPLPPPQGEAAPSAQRTNSVAGYGGGRSY